MFVDQHSSIQTLMKPFFINLLLALINAAEIIILIMTLYAQVCVPNKVKNMNVKVFNLVLGINKKRFLIKHESCWCKCRLN